MNNTLIVKILLLLVVFCLFIVPRAVAQSKTLKPSRRLKGTKFERVKLLKHIILAIANVLRYKDALTHQAAIYKARKIVQLRLYDSLLVFLAMWILTSNAITATLFTIAVFHRFVVVELFYEDGLRELSEGIDLFITNYSMDRSKNIANALRKTIQSTDSVYLEMHFDRIHEIVTAAEARGAVLLTQFSADVKNEYIKLFARYLYITSHNGDVEEGGKSKLVVNMEHVKYLLNGVVEEHQKYTLNLSGWYAGLLLPILLLDGMRYSAFWLHDSMQMPSTFIPSFYASPVATVIYYGLICVILGFYFSMSTALYSGVLEYQTSFTVSALRRIKDNVMINSFIESRIPKPGSDHWNELKQLMLNAGKVEDVKLHYTRKTITLFSTAVIAFLVLLSGRMGAINAVLSDPFYGLTDNSTRANLTIMAEWITDEEKESFAKLDYTGIRETSMFGDHEGEIKRYVANEYPDSYLTKDAIATRIYSKYQALRMQLIYIGLDFLSYLILCVVGYYLPEIILFMKGFFSSKGKAEEEVMLFISIIFILRDHSMVNARDILYWLNEFSYTFKDPLEKALKKFDESQVDRYLVLQELKEAIGFKKFDVVIMGLEQTLNGSTVADAFSTLSQRQEHYQKLYENHLEWMTRERIDNIKFFTRKIVDFSFISYLVFPTAGAIFVVLMKSIDQMYNI